MSKVTVLAKLWALYKFLVFSLGRHCWLSSIDRRRRPSMVLTWHVRYTCATVERLQRGYQECGCPTERKKERKREREGGREGGRERERERERKRICECFCELLGSIILSACLGAVASLVVFLLVHQYGISKFPWPSLNRECYRVLW